jgi:GrpB-like predicted nucleotidyltransferase (UPF0157 family)
MIENTKKTILVTEWDPNWKHEFNKLKNTLEFEIKDIIIEILHVGSTSIKGLAAKPIIDIVIVGELEKFSEIKNRLKKLEYYHNGDQGVKGREAFNLPNELKTKYFPHHLYFCDPNASELKRYRSFLKYLNDNNEIMKEYGKIKMQGAKLHPTDIEAYMDYKGDFIAKHLALALKRSNDLPIIEKQICKNCQSEIIELNFLILYIGGGGKKEYYNCSCLNCKSEWKIELFD